MCGIFGFFDTNNSDIFYDLGKYSETRGKEASGFMNISKNNQVIYKFPLPFSDKLLSSMGLVVPELFSEISNLERFETRNDERVFENELYNLKNDPSESKDLSKQNPKIAKELETKLVTWQKEMKAKHGALGW